MKNLKVKLMTVVLIFSLGLTSCYGPFRLTQNLYNWNGSLGDKWVNSLVFFGLTVIPVYSVAVTIDAVILNTIEFWTGSNPVSMKDGESSEKIVTNENGTYKVTATPEPLHHHSNRRPGKRKVGAPENQCKRPQPVGLSRTKSLSKLPK